MGRPIIASIDATIDNRQTFFRPTAMDERVDPEQFVALLTANQSHSRAYVLAIVRDHNHAMDIVQQVNIVLWQKSSELTDTSKFLPWALTVAKFKALAFFRDQQRDRLVFDSRVTEAIADVAVQYVENLSARRRALRQCLSRSPERHRELLNDRYVKNLSIANMAAAAGKTTDAVNGLLKRVRRALLECVTRRIASSEASH